MTAKKRNRFPLLSPLETDVMQVVWDKGEVTASDVRKALSATRPLAHTTVITMLDRLLKKDVLEERPGTGRSRRFKARVPREDVAEQLLGNIRKKFFQGSAASLVAHLMSDPAVDEEEMVEIRKILDEKMK